MDFLPITSLVMMSLTRDQKFKILCIYYFRFRS